MNQFHRSYFVTRFTNMIKRSLYTTVFVDREMKALYIESGFQANTTATQEFQQLIVNMKNFP